MDLTRIALALPAIVVAVWVIARRVPVTKQDVTYVPAETLVDKFNDVIAFADELGVKDIDAQKLRDAVARKVMPLGGDK